MSPTGFRKAFVQHSAQFAGYAQHDAQEFLAALLDKLHEDLNQGTRLPSTRSAPSLAALAAPEAAAASRRVSACSSLELIVLVMFVGARM